MYHVFATKAVIFQRYFFANLRGIRGIGEHMEPRVAIRSKHRRGRNTSNSWTDVSHSTELQNDVVGLNQR